MYYAIIICITSTKKKCWNLGKRSYRNPLIDPKCVVRGLRLDQYRTEVRYHKMEVPAFKDGE